MEFLLRHQLNIMLLMTGICAMLAVLSMLTHALTPRRRAILALLEAVAALLLIADRCDYLYRGDTSELGYWMVRISNFLLYFFTLCMAHGFTRYLRDLYANEGALEKVPRRLRACEIIFLVGVAMLVVAHFNGLYYTFDAQNLYHRAPLNLLGFISPVLIVFIQLSLIVQYRKRLHPIIVFSLVLFCVVPMLAAVIQLYAYGLSILNLSMAAMCALLYVYALIALNNALEQARQREIEAHREERRKERALFEQTAEALVNAIEAKDKYTTGHSQRVAEYSRSIAHTDGKPEEACEEIYFAALLHDVGKIGIPIKILNKNGKLTDEEYALIKQHPVVGSQILGSIHQSPYLSIAARYHHERYDGRGYPEGLKGEEIPEIARIIAVADAYDAMSSNRSYRSAIPQHIVREELVKGIGTQFDPEFAKAMIQLLDHDVEYRMRESESGEGLIPAGGLRCRVLYDECTGGIPVTRKPVSIRLITRPDEDAGADEGLPTLIVFDALDARVHPGEEQNKDLLYFEYALIRLDGRVDERNTRRVEVRPSDWRPDNAPADSHAVGSGTRYDIEAVKVKDHAMIRISNGARAWDVILALPDCSRFAYISIGGERCTVSDLHVENAESEAAAGYIPRIAEEISHIKGCPVGDVPNLQIDGWRTDATEGIPIGDGLDIAFHTKSLPTARLVWHCPFISVFSSSDARVNGAGVREYMLMRLDGENWESDKYAENKVYVYRSEAFQGWNAWKAKNKEGLDCRVEIRREGNRITMRTENLGIAVSSITTLRSSVKDVYIALTGDQWAITNIRVQRGK